LRSSVNMILPLSSLSKQENTKKDFEQKVAKITKSRT